MSTIRLTAAQALVRTMAAQMTVVDGRTLPGHSGWMVIEAERDPAKANPLRCARFSYANLRRTLADAGVRDRAL